MKRCVVIFSGGKESVFSLFGSKIPRIRNRGSAIFKEARVFST